MSLSSALARATRWRSPLDRAPQASWARSVDGPQGAADAIGRVGHLVEVGEAFEVLGHGQAQIQAW
jgi:hypothetical protein